MPEIIPLKLRLKKFTSLVSYLLELIKLLLNKHHLVQYLKSKIEI